MGLAEARLLGEAHPRQLACFNPFPQDFAEIFLQDFEFHSGSIAFGFAAT
jgi:hypothetical protein